MAFSKHDQVWDEDYGAGEVYSVQKGWVFVNFESGLERAIPEDDTRLIHLKEHTQLRLAVYGGQ